MGVSFSLFSLGIGQEGVKIGGAGLLTKIEKKRLGDLLLEAGVITEEQLKVALTEQKKSRKRLGEVLIEKGFLTEEKLLAFLAEQLKIPRVKLKNLVISPEVAASIPASMAKRYHALPVQKEGKNLTVAMADPLDVVALDDIAMATGCSISPVIASRREMGEVISRFFGGEKVEIKELEDFSGVAVAAQDGDFLPSAEAAEEAPAIQMVNSLLFSALEQEASDIHLEPLEKGLKVRLRVDGQLHDAPPPPRELAPLILSRLKIMSNMDISERRLPQDGNIKFVWNKKDINIRVSTLPTIYGEKIVLRILSPDKIIMPMESLGFNAENKRLYLSFLKNAYGMLLVTGPTGSGKTTTLYSTLHHINRPELNIVTVEDPVEYRLGGINQVQVSRKIGLTFASALRSILRQDPDVIMVGEIRDAETAEIACRAALTGHLVFSTLHTNDAPSAVTRLLDMGVEPFLLNSSLIGVVAQRLIRLICGSCREEDTPSEEEIEFFRKASDATSLPVFYKGRGCAKCNFTGFKGRTAIHEVMKVDRALRTLILRSSDPEKIRQKALESGMKTLLQDGMRCVQEGKTTVQEVLRVAYGALE